MPSVSHKPPTLKPYQPTLFEMPPGAVGVTDDGRYFYRTFQTAACLSEPGLTIVQLCSDNCPRVTILPPGTVLTITL